MNKTVRISRGYGTNITASFFVRYRIWEEQSYPVTEMHDAEAADVQLASEMDPQSSLASGAQLSSQAALLVYPPQGGIWSQSVNKKHNNKKTKNTTHGQQL